MPKKERPSKDDIGKDIIFVGGTDHFTKKDRKLYIEILEATIARGSIGDINGWANIKETRKAILKIQQDKLKEAN